MSAIAGIWTRHPSPLLNQHLDTMMQVLSHFPADDAGIWSSPVVALGCHTRWITPESILECLPYHHPTFRNSITADAILDNREELFSLLHIDYFKRRHMTDSELILRAYAKWGINCPRYLLGDFSFVIWDEYNKRLFGARDLLGNRTLYFEHHCDQFAFCTTMSPLLAISDQKPSINESWLAEFLAIPVILDTIDVKSTVYQGIHQLPPAHFFTVEDGRLKIDQYDGLKEPAEKLRLRSNGEYEEAFRDVFQTAVASKLRTFRQVGVKLSGGLDSGSIAAFASKFLHQEGKRLHTFSYIPPSDFADWTNRYMVADETPYIQSIARHAGNTRNHFLRFPERNSITVVDELLDSIEAPYKFLENSFWLTGIAEQAQMESIGVMLTGGRGNYTVSWGPACDYYAQLMRKVQWIKLYREMKQYSRIEGISRFKLFPFVGSHAFPLAARWMNKSREKDSMRPMLIHPEFAKRTEVMEKLQPYYGHVDMNGMQTDDFSERRFQFEHLATSNHYGTSTTKLSLRYGIADRDPTNDPRVIRFCLSLPYDQFVQHGRDRSIIRRAVSGLLPDDVRMNQRVRGVQGADWLYRLRSSWDTLTDELHHMCLDPVASAYLHINQVKQSLNVVGASPKSELAFDPHARLLMQSLIVYRFLKRTHSLERR
ncbi:asparagine synthase-related protein [Paenibacillus lemnae]|uniref:asparagine synthase (glutamine-hydrolyzing) n=1 Tax=Paenibacillus lemnae TaxID=1330551 RepID=A0A848MC73_PAELE|nr:asparagine synthase-related protein [Paenibacillus lemnae]NMO97642.1 asparagine synthetase B [Paenibacillus lemnae]